MRIGARGKMGASSIGPVNGVLLAQLGLSTVLAAVLWGADGIVSAYSALLGGLAAVIPNAFLALRLLAPRRDPGAGALMRAAYVGELGKLALTVAIFAAVFSLVARLSAGALFAGFVVAQVATIAGLMVPDREWNTGNGNGK